MKQGELVLGPFQGKTACTRIKSGKGVCGTAVVEMKVQLVPDVHLFPGHIACDCASNSEIVVPIIKDGVLYGVLDIDSPSINRFDELDAKYLQLFVDKLSKYIDWNHVH
jgi:GAF domain-containing protein